MNHQQYLLEALSLAEKRRGFCSPNPSVGAVVVKNQEIIGRGYHQGLGSAHAEVMACQNLPDNSDDVSLYVTLEPCCHWGRTPPCTDLIIQKGIKRVYYGYQDPNLIVAGKGAEVLRAQGIECQQVNLREIEEFYRSYSYWTLTKKPWVTSKLAISLDAKIADSESKPVIITGDIAKAFTHTWRGRSDALITSVKTIIQDDPLLNVRIADNPIAKPLYILDARLELPLNSKIINSAEKITLFYCQEDQEKIKKLRKNGIICHQIPELKGKLDLQAILVMIGSDGIHDLWLEAGGKVFTAFITQQLVQKSFIYIAPKLLGANALPAFNEQTNIFSYAKQINWQEIGEDILCEIDW